MKIPRKIIVHIATSADGYIARPDGDVAWLDRRRPKGNYGYSTFFKSVDTILWGYKTYAKGIEMGMEKAMKAAGFGPQIKNYVFSANRARHHCPPSNSSTSHSNHSPSACAPSPANTSG